MEDKIKTAIEKELNNINVELLNVKIGVEDNNKTLFITIDSDNGVDTDLCVKVTKIVNPIIDGLNLELEDYILDVGSKGN